LKREEDAVDVDDDAISTVSDSFSTVSINEEHIVQQRSLEQAYESNNWGVKKVTLSVLLKLPKTGVERDTTLEKFKRENDVTHILFWY